MKEQQELQTRLEKLKREANEVKIASLQDKMVGLQEEMARKAKNAEKELQVAQVSSSGGSSFRSISPVGTPDDNLTKVSGWLDKTEEAENVAQPINVQQYTSKRPSQHQLLQYDQLMQDNAPRK